MRTAKGLRDTTSEDLVLRGVSANTVENYVGCARRFAEHFGRSPCRMGAAEIRAFLLWLSGAHAAQSSEGCGRALPREGGKCRNRSPSTNA